jgi:hypothetical protein
MAWTCVCTLVNEDNVGACVLCEALRPFEEAHAKGGSGKQKGGKTVPPRPVPRSYPRGGTFQMCKHIQATGICLNTKKGCNFAHSPEELALWNAPRSRGKRGQAASAVSSSASASSSTVYSHFNSRRRSHN